MMNDLMKELDTPNEKQKIPYGKKKKKREDDSDHESIDSISI